MDVACDIVAACVNIFSIRVDIIYNTVDVFIKLFVGNIRILRREYLGPRGMRMGSGEGFTMGKFIVCTVHLI